MKKLINTPQSRTTRYDSSVSPDDISGLYTDNFSECLCIFLVKKTPHRIQISLTHVDRFISNHFLEQELAWIGEDCEKIIVRKDSLNAQLNVSSKLTPAFVKAAQPIIAPQDAFGYGHDGTTLSAYTRETIPKLASHPHEWKWHNQYLLHIYINEKLPAQHHQNRLIFDGRQWTLANDFEFPLRNIAEKFYSLYSKCLAVSKAHLVEGMNLITKIFEKYELEEPGLGLQTLINNAAYVLFQKNNISKIFQLEMKHYAVPPLPESLITRLDEFAANASEGNIPSSEVWNDALAPFEQRADLSQEIGRIKGIFKLCKRFEKHAAAYPCAAPSQAIISNERDLGDEKEAESSLLRMAI